MPPLAVCWRRIGVVGDHVIADFTLCTVADLDAVLGDVADRAFTLDHVALHIDLRARAGYHDAAFLVGRHALLFVTCPLVEPLQSPFCWPVMVA